MNIDAKVIGSRIRNRRTQLGLTQKELADQAGISPPAINRFEKGDKSPSIDTLVKLAKILGTSTDFLLGAESAEGLFLDSDTCEAFKNFTSLPQEHRQIVLANIKFFKDQKK